jgi:hypothetical protein
VLCQHKVLRRGYAARTVRWLSWSGLRLAKASFALQALWSLHKFSLGTHTLTGVPRAESSIRFIDSRRAHTLGDRQPTERGSSARARGDHTLAIAPRR